MGKRSRGITLIALVITIIVLLILAGVTIATLTGDNGILTQAGSAKEKTEIAEEKEIIKMSTMQAMMMEKSTKIIKANLEEILKQNESHNEIEIIDCGENIVAKFIKSNRYYQIDFDGNVTGPLEFINDEFAGDLSKNGQYDGSEDKPYQINCIEDLVEFSQNYKNYTGNIKLTRTLDFLSILSYNDYNTTIYGDLNQDGTINDLRTELIDENGIGFIPIALLNGTFNGNNNEIRNIYINSTSNAGLFLAVEDYSEIKNLGITGKITTTGSIAGGILARCENKYMTISNCYNVGIIVGEEYAGRNMWSIFNGKLCK